MKKSIAVIGAVLLFAFVAIAQDTPRGEVFMGYTYTRANSASNVPAFSANGGGGQFVLNVGKWFGAVADLGAVHNGNIGGNQLDSTFTNFLFGPRITIRHWSRVQPYFQTLFGGVYASTSTQVAVTATPEHPIVIPPPVAPTPYSGGTAITNGTVNLRASHQQTSFAMTVGGGLDIKINKWASFRPIGLDYYMTRLQNLRTQNDNNQHNIRYTTGFNFTFGAQ